MNQQPTPLTASHENRSWSFRRDILVPTLLCGPMVAIAVGLAMLAIHDRNAYRKAFRDSFEDSMRKAFAKDESPAVPIPSQDCLDRAESAAQGVFLVMVFLLVLSMISRHPVAIVSFVVCLVSFLLTLLEHVPCMAES